MQLCSSWLWCSRCAVVDAGAAIRTFRWQRHALLDVVDDMVQKYEGVKCANEVLRTKVEMQTMMVGLKPTQAAWGVSLREMSL